MARAGIRITEVGSTELPRLHGASNLRAIPDGIRILRTILAARRRWHQAPPDATTQPAPNKALAAKPQ